MEIKITKDKKIFIAFLIILIVAIISTMFFQITKEENVFAETIEINSLSTISTEPRDNLFSSDIDISDVKNVTDNVLEYIPIECFKERGKYQGTYENYGYFVYTYPEFTGLSSYVLLFDIIKYCNESNNTYTVTIKPTYNLRFNYEPEIDLLTYVFRGDETTYLAIGNTQYYGNIVNTHEALENDNYIKSLDNGYFIQGAYTDGNYLIKKDNNVALGVAESVLSIILGELAGKIPGGSVVMGMFDILSEFDYEDMIPENGVNHIYYGNYNSQLQSNFIRNVFIRDDIDNEQNRYISAGSNQELSFVLEYDNKNRNQIDAQIRNFLSFDIYEIPEEGSIGGIIKLTDEQIVYQSVSSFNDKEISAKGKLYTIEENSLKFNDGYNYLYMLPDKALKTVFTPEISGKYSIQGIGNIKVLEDNTELDINNLYFEKGKQYEIIIDGVNDQLCNLIITKEQNYQIDKKELFEGVNLLTINTAEEEIKEFIIENIGADCEFYIFDQEKFVINKSRIINNILRINNIFEANKDYYVVAYNKTSETIENIEIREIQSNTLDIKGEFTTVLNSDTDYYINLKNDYTTLYNMSGTGQYSIIEKGTDNSFTVNNSVLLDKSKNYYLKINANNDNENIIVKMAYNSKSISNDENVEKYININNIYDFTCNYSGKYNISNIEQVKIIDVSTNEEISCTDNIVNLEAGHKYLIIEEKINTTSNQAAKIEIENKETEFCKRESVVAGTLYKLISDYTGYIMSYPEINNLSIYDSDLNKLTKNELIEGNTYYILAKDNITEFTIMPQYVVLENAGESIFEKYRLFKTTVQDNAEKRITIFNDEASLNCNVIIYDSAFNILNNQNINSQNYFNDIIVDMTQGTYYIGVFNASANGVISINDKVKSVGLGDRIFGQINNERKLEYILTINKATNYICDFNGCIVNIGGEEITSGINNELSPGQYILEIEGMAKLPSEFELIININADKRHIVSVGENMEKDVIYELCGFESGAYQFEGIGEYKIYDNNINEIVFDEQLVLDINKKYYIELVDGTSSDYKFIDKYHMLDQTGFTINLKKDNPYYFAFDNFNQDFVAIYCSNPDVEIAVFESLKQNQEEVISYGRNIVFAYSKNNIRYVGFNADVDAENIEVKVLDPKAIVENEILWEQAMDMGSGYLRYVAPTTGKYNITCSGSNNDVEVFNQQGIKLSGDYDFIQGNTYLIKHTSNHNHILKIALIIEELSLNSKHTLVLNSDKNYFLINMNYILRVFSTTHDLKVYETANLNEPYIAIAKKNAGCINPFAGSSRIIEVEKNGNENLEIYVWEDLTDKNKIEYNLNGQSIEIDTETIVVDVRDSLEFSLTNEYDSISNNIYYERYIYKCDEDFIGISRKVISVEIILYLDNIEIDKIVKVVNLEVIGKPDNINIKFDNDKTHYNGFDNIYYSITMNSGYADVEGYDYTISQIGGNNEIIVNKNNKQISFDTTKDLYGKTFYIKVICGETSIEKSIKIQVDQIISFDGYNIDKIPSDSDYNVELKISPSSKSLRISLINIKDSEVMWWYPTLEFVIPGHIQYVEFVGNKNAIHIITINLLGKTTIKIKDLYFAGVNHGIYAADDMTLLIEGEVAIFGDKYCYFEQAYPGIEVDGDLKIRLFDGAKLNVKGGVGRKGTNGSNGQDGADGKDGSYGVDGEDGKRGTDGGDGGNGKNGQVGIEANNILLLNKEKVTLLIEGGPGGEGGDGGAGGDGGNGGADTSWYLCNAGKGGNGGDGGNGGNGGYGSVALKCTSHNIPSEYLIDHDTTRNLGGEGGAGGKGGAGGDGGAIGFDGKDGKAGTGGSHGELNEGDAYLYTDYDWFYTFLGEETNW